MAYKPGGDLVTKDGRTSQFVASGFTDTQTVHLDVQDVQAQTAFMLIDVSDTTNWPHTNVAEINIEYILIEVDPDANFVGEIKIGFLSNVDGDNGDFNQLLDIDMVRKSDLLVEELNFGSHGIHCTTDHHFGLVTANSILFRTGVNLKGPDGNTSYPSGDGDLVLLVEVSAGAVDVSLIIGYETVAVES